jgi:GntR family transcriptional regulator/MocR family aminotransferase
MDTFARADYARYAANPMKSRRPSATSPASLLLRLDPAGQFSLQSQIYEGIRQAILSGVLPGGASLPSSRTLAADLGVSRTTVLLALDQLVAEGYATARRGSGHFVGTDIPDRAMGHRRPDPAGPAKSDHPALSARAAALAATPRTAIRAASHPRPFRLGTPALDRFPSEIWSRLVRRHAQKTMFDQMDYGPAAGVRALREAIAAHVNRSRGTACVADQVFIVNGAQHGLEFLFQLLIDPGETVAGEEPGYPGAVGAVRAAGGRWHAVTVDDEGLDVGMLRAYAPDARVAYVTPSHQFPLGVPMSLRRRLELLTWARETGAWIVEDDYDSEFRHGTRPVPCLHGLDRGGRVLYVGTFSKTLFPALRLGFVIVPLDLCGAVHQARRSTDIQPATAPQAVLAEFLAEGHFDRHLRRMRREYDARLDALGDALARHCSGVLTLRPATTGLHAVGDLTGADDVAVAEQALARGIEVMPLSSYYVDASSVRANGLVLGFGAVRPELLDRGAATLAAAIETAARQPNASG